MSTPGTNGIPCRTTWSHPLGSAVLDIDAKATRYGSALSPSSALATAAYSPSNPDLLINPAWVADLEVGADAGGSA